MNWCFSTVNGRAAEIFFEKRKGGGKEIQAHAYVNVKNYKTKKEKRWIANETKRIRLSYRKKKYRLLSVPSDVPSTFHLL